MIQKSCPAWCLRNWFRMITIGSYDIVESIFSVGLHVVLAFVNSKYSL